MTSPHYPPSIIANSASHDKHRVNPQLHSAPHCSFSAQCPDLVPCASSNREESREERRKEASCRPVSRRSPLLLPEILQEICRYLDTRALLQGCLASKSLLQCCRPLLWIRVPTSAWENNYFLSSWPGHASRIRVLACGPSVSLTRISVLCRNLVSLDITSIHGHTDTYHHTTVGHDTRKRISMTTASPGTIQEAFDPAIGGQKRSPEGVFGRKYGSTAPRALSDPFRTFQELAIDLTRLIQCNEKIQCLRFKPHGPLPMELLEALSKAPCLQSLSLVTWNDFQEEHLQAVLEACPKLYNLSLNDNDFTEFTLEKLSTTSVYPLAQDFSRLENPWPSLDTITPVVKLERYDDPIKGKSGPMRISNLSNEPSNEDQHLVLSKQAVLYTPGGLPFMASGAMMQNQGFSTTRNLSPRWFTQIRSLSLHHTGLRQEFLVNLTRQCPYLEHLSLLDGWGFYPTSKFATILSHTCPKLARIEFREQALDLQDEFFISLCKRFPRIQWIHAGKTGFSQGSMDAIQRHCTHLVSLNVDGARGIQSPSLDLVLRTCRTLKALSACGVVLNGRDLSCHSKWVCLGIESLALDIEVYNIVSPSSTESVPESVGAVRRRVYSHLADLTRLRRLALGGGHRVGGTEAGVDLTLESGVEQLETLRCLEHLDLRRLSRAIGEGDFQWMVEKWPMFYRLEVGKSRAYNRAADRTHKGIEWLSQARPGMDIRLL